MCREGKLSSRDDSHDLVQFDEKGGMALPSEYMAFRPAAFVAVSETKVIVNDPFTLCTSSTPEVTVTSAVALPMSCKQMHTMPSELQLCTYMSVVLCCHLKKMGYEFKIIDAWCLKKRSNSFLMSE